MNFTASRIPAQSQGMLIPMLFLVMLTDSWFTEEAPKMRTSEVPLDCIGRTESGDRNIMPLSATVRDLELWDRRN